MAAVYFESSAVLSWLLGEVDAEKVRETVGQAETVITATLTLVESRRALVRGELQGAITEADRRRLGGLLSREAAQWALMEFSETVRARASDRFPGEPVRSLDAIHLASALEAQGLYSDLRVLSLDLRILANLEPLGLVATDQD